MDTRLKDLPANQPIRLAHIPQNSGLYCTNCADALRPDTHTCPSCGTLTQRAMAAGA